MIVVGSSKHIYGGVWRIWSFDPGDGTITPLAEFNDKSKSDTAAFELAHAAGRLENPTEIDSILAARDSDPAPLLPKEAPLLTALAEDAIQMSEKPEERKSAITVRRTLEDLVFVVRYPPSV